MGVAIFAVVNLVIGLAAISMLFGTFETLFGKPKLSILRPSRGGNVFAFGFKWNSAKEPAALDTIKIRLFNPFGSPTQAEVTHRYEAKKSSFALEADMGPGLIELLGAKGLDKATVQVELSSSKDGVTFQFDMKGPKFRQMVTDSLDSVENYIKRNKLDVVKKSKPPIDIPIREFIADTVPGKGAQLAIASNPAFAAQFAGLGAGGVAAGGAPAEAVPNFAVLKVWIEPGCIVCNACEDIYPEVFEVTSDTCLIRAGAPLDDGLKIQEAAEACPVEVIKYNKVS
jgi:ferredoxin